MDDRKKILVVDDEEDVCEILKFNLVNAGYEVDTAYSSEEALIKLAKNFDLLLLDVMLGGISGFTLADVIRKELHNDVPIIFITAKDTVDDKLKGFNVGADDYILKPFSIKEVMARIQAVLSRTALYKKAEEERREYNKKHPGHQVIEISGLKIDSSSKQVIINGTTLSLTKKEYEILYMLASSPSKFYSRQEILDAVWENEVYVLERTVDVHIARLRKKLGFYGSMIINRSGFGYCFNPSEIEKDKR
jgi:DNA-binding response OmpR family regulator